MIFTEWFNFDTERYDALEDTPEDYAPYIPEGAARNLYKLLIEHEGQKPGAAAIYVLKRCAGIAPEEK